MNSEINDILTKSIADLIENSSKDSKIIKLEKTHKEKLHFIPYRYRIFGGILQSMNIQFGNFIEKIIAEILSRNDNIELLNGFIKKQNSFLISSDSDRLIDDYITDCQLNNYSDTQLTEKFKTLIETIKINEANEALKTERFSHDVDVLFKDKNSGIYYYGEIKYNDDHDTGKFVDINRKLLKTYAYLQRQLGADKELYPILIYFNNKKMKGNIYLPEEFSIYRGKRFFDKFTNVDYNELDISMKNISESPETKKIFDELYKKIVN